MIRLFAAVALFGSAYAAEAQSAREVELMNRIEALEKRLAQVEAKLAPPAAAQPQPTLEAKRAVAAVDVNLMLDSYYGWNFNRPVRRTNQVWALDTRHNSLSINQAVAMLERAPDPAAGRRFGARIDLRFGQATEVYGGSLGNESRPAAWRRLFQAYGTYVAPIGKGLTVDFGKWSSLLGMEGVYTKDQMNYSRSMLFTVLPFYHLGMRATYDFSDRVGAGYWLVNGNGQSDDFNGARSHNVTFRARPAKAVSWTVNYYTGNENADPADQGRLHIVDTFATWTASPKLTLAGEFDYLMRRIAKNGPPAHVTGGAAYLRYQFTGKLAVAGRAEYLSDRGGMFSGATQALNEATVTADYALGGNFLMRWEWRRDSSNRAYFVTERAGQLKKEQNTATLGLVWWFGPKITPW